MPLDGNGMDEEALLFKGGGIAAHNGATEPSASSPQVPQP